MADPKPTPQAEANTDLDSAGSGTSLSDVAAALRAAFNYAGGGFNFDSDINMIEGLKYYSTVVAASAATSKVAVDFARDQLVLANSAAQSGEVLGNTIGNNIAKLNAVDQAMLGQDRKWNVDEVSGYAVLNTTAVADTVKAAVSEGFAEVIAALRASQPSGD